MALNTYTNLLASLASALHRNDLTSVLPDCVTLAEDKFNKRLRIRAMENRQTADVASEYIALPTGYLALRNLQVNSTPRALLEYAAPEWLDRLYPDTTSTGEPKFYTLVGGSIQLAPVPDGTYTIEIDFYKKWDIATDGTNWLLTNAPRTYYYGALMEAAAFLVNDKRIPVWSALLEKALQEVEEADSKDDYPAGGTLMMRPDFRPV
jgi:hypothetical protein